MEGESDRYIGEEREEGESVGKVSGSLAEKPAEVREFLFLAHLLFGSFLLSYLTLLVYAVQKRKEKETSPKGMNASQEKRFGTLLESLATKS